MPKITISQKRKVVPQVSDKFQTTLTILKMRKWVLVADFAAETNHRRP